MKKKILAIVLVLVMASTITGCGNMSLGLGNFTYKKIHVDTHHYSGCFTIEKWYDSGTGVEVTTEEAGSIFLSEGTYILLEEEDNCPFCGVTEDN